jgi:hypothetical protein
MFLVVGKNKLKSGGPRQQTPYSDPLRRESSIQKLPQDGKLPSETHLKIPETGRVSGLPRIECSTFLAPGDKNLNSE